MFDKLYTYQKEAVTTTLFNNKGIICLPTGTGKTFCQAAIIANDIQQNIGQFRMYIINAPRIILTYQLLKEIYGYLVHSGIEARYMFVHSGGKTDERELEDIRLSANIDGNNIPFSEFGSGTSQQTIIDYIKKAKRQQLPLIFFSTYNSANRIEDARVKVVKKQPVSIILNDEAHYLVQEQFHDILNTINSSRCYFFTATTINTPSDRGRGMNNLDVYGNILYSMTPREAIDIGKMIRPRLHFMTTDKVYTTDDYDTSISRLIHDGYFQHEATLTKNQTPKLLVSVKGTQDIITFLNSEEYKVLRSKDINIYAVSSNQDINNDINGTKVSRQDFLKTLKLDGSNINKKMIVLHYDILAEGIDISGFTGIMPLRTLNKSKFLQTYGRAARLDLNDKQNIEEGKILIPDLKKYNKPYAYIVIPDVIHNNEDDKQNIIQLITELRSYGFKPAEDIVASNMIHGVPKIEELPSLNEVIKRLPNVGELIENLDYELEMERIAKLSKNDFITDLLTD